MRDGEHFAPNLGQNLPNWGPRSSHYLRCSHIPIQHTYDGRDKVTKQRLFGGDGIVIFRNQFRRRQAILRLVFVSDGIMPSPKQHHIKYINRACFARVRSVGHKTNMFAVAVGRAKCLAADSATGKSRWSNRTNRFQACCDALRFWYNVTSSHAQQQQRQQTGTRTANL